MATVRSPDHPTLPYVQAGGYTHGRPMGAPLWVVIHDMEAPETVGRARNTAGYFASPGDGRQVSSHYCCDAQEVVQCVRLADSAWTVGNREGNYLGINYEYAGRANQTRGQWLDQFGLAMLNTAAPVMRADMARYGIPLHRCTLDDLRARRKGFTSHNDLREVFGSTTHTDPGPAFPWDTLFNIIAGDTVTPAELHQLLVETILSDGKTSVNNALLTGYDRAGLAANIQLPQVLGLLTAQSQVLGHLAAGTFDPAQLDAAVTAAVTSAAAPLLQHIQALEAELHDLRTRLAAAYAVPGAAVTSGTALT